MCILLDQIWYFTEVKEEWYFTEFKDETRTTFSVISYRIQTLIQILLDNHLDRVTPSVICEK